MLMFSRRSRASAFAGHAARDALQVRIGPENSFAS